MDRTTLNRHFLKLYNVFQWMEALTKSIVEGMYFGGIIKTTSKLLSSAYYFKIKGNCLLKTLKFKRSQHAGEITAKEFSKLVFFFILYLWGP